MYRWLISELFESLTRMVICVLVALLTVTLPEKIRFELVFLSKDKGTNELFSTPFSRSLVQDSRVPMQIVADAAFSEISVEIAIVTWLFSNLAATLISPAVGRSPVEFCI